MAGLSPGLSFGTLQPPKLSSSSAVSHSGEGHVSLSEGCSPGPLCGQWATGRKVERGQAVCQRLGTSSQPWQQLPRALPSAHLWARSSAVHGPCTSSTGGAVPFAGGAPGARRGGLLRSHLCGQSWKAGPFPVEPGAVSLPAATTHGPSWAHTGCPEQRAVSAQRSMWLPALCILSPFIMSLFHLCCAKSWGTSARGCRHLLGEREGSRAHPARAGAAPGSGTAGELLVFGAVAVLEFQGRNPG